MNNSDPMEEDELRNNGVSRISYSNKGEQGSTLRLATAAPSVQDILYDLAEWCIKTRNVSNNQLYKAEELINAHTTNKIIEELEKFDAMKPETGAYLSDMIAERIAELKGKL